MKKVLGLLFGLVFTGAIFAQGPPRGGMQGMSQGTIKGKVVDTAANPIAGIPVYILQLKKDSTTGKVREILYKSLVTASNGTFVQEEIPAMPPVKVKIAPVGYVEVDSIVRFVTMVDGKPTSTPNRNLGNITLHSTAGDLKEVVVTSEQSKPLLKMEIDKKVFNVEKNIVSTGGTALDVLKNVPSVNVDIDGNVKMRNAAPQIYVDGRPSTLTPDQIPSDAVESVEIMTNPSAKYDASGGNAGILNIVLKKNRKMGYNGNLRAGVDRFGGINAGADINVRQGKFNFSASGMYNQNKGKTTGTTDRKSFSNDTTFNISQNNTDHDKGGFMFGKVGVDYFMDENTTFSVSGTKVHGSMKPYSDMDIITDSIWNGQSIGAGYSRRHTNSDRTFNGNGLSIGVKHLFDKPNQQWTADFNYFGGNGDFTSMYNTNFFANGWNNPATGYQLQEMINDGNMRHITAQTDYTMPLGDKGKLEAGLRAQLQRSDFYNYNALGNVNSDLSNPYSTTVTSYLSHNNVYAAYATYTNALGSFGYQLGLRAERSNYDGTLRTTEEKFSNKYPINLFPTIYLTEDLKYDQQLQFTFTRRINRPNFFQLMPITDYTDTLNITRGNPDLRPEFTNKFELGYVKTFNKNNVFMASAYYGRTTGLLTRYIEQETNPISGAADLINTYINANSSYNMGLELTATNSLTKWWDLTSNVNIYKSKINTGNAATEQDAMWSWYGKLNNSFKLPSKFSIQLSGNYQSKTNLPVNDSKGMGFGPPQAAQSSSQGYIKAFWNTDFAIKKEFFKDSRLSATLAVSDIFRSNKSTQYSESAYFTQMYSRLRNPQMVRLTLAYRFGKVDTNLFKRKNMNQSGMSDAMQGM